jgi:hypothetical protein
MISVQFHEFMLLTSSLCEITPCLFVMSKISFVDLALMRYYYYGGIKGFEAQITTRADRLN